MERSIAINKLGKLLGKNFGYQINSKAPTPEERTEAQTATTAAVETRNKLKEQRDERYRLILAGDAEYQRLHAEHKIACDHVNTLFSITRHYKITVGTSNSMFFHIKAEGDSWEDVIGKVEALKS